MARRSTGTVALRQPERRHRCDGEEREQRPERHREQPAAPPCRLEALPLQLPAAAPREHRLGEDVVEDLVALAAARGAVDRAEDPLAVERREHRAHQLFRHRRVLGEIARALRDLRTGRRDEVVEHLRGDVLLLRNELVERALDVRAYDCPCPAEPAQRRELQRGRPLCTLRLPDAFQHELEIRRLDPAGTSSAVDDAEARAAEVDLAGDDFVQHGRDKLRVDGDVLARELVPALDRAENGRARRLRVEVLETELVCKDVRDARLEDVELSESVLAQREQDVDVGLAQQLRQVVQQRARPVFVRVVHEVLLELIEDQIPAVCGAGLAQGRRR